MNKRVQTVPVETVQVGDLVSLTWKEDDVTRSAYGRISDIVFAGRVRKLISEAGHEIGKYDLTHPRKVQCVMHERYAPMTTLPGLEFNSVDLASVP